MLILTGGVANASTIQTSATVKPVSALVDTSSMSTTSTASTSSENLNNQTASTTATSSATTTDSMVLIPNNDNVKAAVAKYFANEPLLTKIAMCESRDRQFAPDGNVFRGVVNNKDVGVMQINEKYHAKRALSLGIDIYSLEGNMQYAKLLFDEQGSQPWISSSPCWGKYVTGATVAMK